MVIVSWMFDTHKCMIHFCVYTKILVLSMHEGTTIFVLRYKECRTVALPEAEMIKLCLKGQKNVSFFIEISKVVSNGKSNYSGHSAVQQYRRVPNLIIAQQSGAEIKPSSLKLKLSYIIEHHQFFSIQGQKRMNEPNSKLIITCMQHTPAFVICI